ncbi:hypothetical protein [Streptomyces sp. NPDC088775]|uniref:hypothetical protein n=1 Tax=Streptomyces sp. NPDC088775 TaxID=3365896 RepID=UPI0037F4539B
MIPAPHRTKGGALILGASRAGQSGPFGPYGSDTGDDIEEQDQAYAEPADDGTN